jgi:drug/metabolite transporter (DMT)-like permease
MNFSTLVPVVVVVASATLYHITQKSIGRGVNPWGALAAVYFVAFVGTLIGACLVKAPATGYTKIFTSIPAIFFLGVACIGIEAGYLFAYRRGGNISALYTQTSAGMCFSLFLVGLLVFGEPISAKKIAGLILAAVGVGLMH